MKNKQPEYQLQKQVAQTLNAMNLVWCASAGGIRTSFSQAKKMKATGYKRGFPDVFIYQPNKKYNGLAIELKVKGNYPSIYQKEWIAKLNENGYYAIVCTGYEKTIEVINKYINNDL